MELKQLFFIMLLALAFSGCSPTENKINIIKGAGNANNSLVLSFSELCPGTVEGFGADNDNVLISVRNGEKLELYNINADTREREFIFSAVADEHYYTEVSPDGRNIILNDQLISLESREASYLPPQPLNNARPGRMDNIPRYSFFEGSEVILTDPYYYLNKYFKVSLNRVGEGHSTSYGIILAGDIRTTLRPESYKAIKAPEIDAILDFKLIPRALKFVFTGIKSQTGDVGLYAFDFTARKFTLLDSNVRFFSISPDGNSIAYVKNAPGQTSVTALCTSMLNGEGKKELDTLEEINSVAWSSDSQWVAYSGSNNSSSDVFVCKYDGSAQEQLTSNINSAGKLAWKGNRLAFTSVYENKETPPTTYIITLNTDNTESLPFSNIVPGNQTLYKQLVDFLRKETSVVLSKRAKN